MERITFLKYLILEIIQNKGGYMNVSSDVQLVGVCIIGVVIGIPFMIHWIKDRNYPVQLMVKIGEFFLIGIPRIRKKNRDKFIRDLSKKITKDFNQKPAKFSSKTFDNRDSIITNKSHHNMECGKNNKDASN